eukprot:CAMPEP_0177211200 /NCGR_PEP_ID=MMETSP0367-20130122/31960_1 /TAXON_ID=447022 ORGANISM="Scrippsiella hangoei-like, Strain SHHI-4" /NCGR_SAMPLE_ID=MMETSP0367 /ASSEMBLY_ACC=CAM_ASM_000362 /LENGTH=390 /DNA_ID=CAMNT_0018660359 /DNA_START=61 /DNA_END=1233 /DNA_ORIENTATION=-
MAAEALAPGNFLFASEAATEGCPDKLCDRIADAVLDACLEQDPDARVSCEACTKTSMVMILGEIVTKASVNYEQVIREAVKAVGFDSEEKGLDARTANVIVAVEETTPDLTQAVAGAKALEEVGNGDMGVVSGYATDETPEMMPLSQLLASRLCARFDKVRKDGTLPWAKLGGRAQVVLEYTSKPDGGLAAVRVHTITITAPRSAEVKAEQVEKDITEHVVKPVLPPNLQGGNMVLRFPDPKQHPQSDVGMSGKQVASDTYGGWGGASCGALSGKDATKVGRSGAYGARLAARSLVSAGLCKRASVQLSYLPGSAAPASVSVNTFGSGMTVSGRSDADLAELVRRNFDFRPCCLQRELGLKSAQFQKVSAHGHFGRSDLELAWEKRKDLK